MPKIKLTDAAVQRLKAPPNERVDYFDATVPGFGVRVSGPTPGHPEGRRSWMIFYRFGGKQKRLTHRLGYPALSLEDARVWAGECFAMLERKEPADPAEVKAAAKVEASRKRDTFEEVMNEFIKRHMEGKRRAPRYIEETRRNFENHVLPRWRDRDIKTITRRDVIALLDEIADGSAPRTGTSKTRPATGGPIAANRVLAAVRALFNWAMRRGIIENTPAALVERPGEETRRERVLTAAELRTIWPAAGKLDTPIGEFFKMVMLLGQRREETAGMRWADLDLTENTWTIPAEMTKAGRLHIVPLPQMAMDILKAMPRKAFLNDKGKSELSPFVFTIGGKASISGYSQMKGRLDKQVAALRKKAELDDIEPWTVHDLRRTVATEMGRLGVPRLTIAKMLNHADRSVTGIYDRHSYLPEKRAALETWAAYLDGLVNRKAANETDGLPQIEAAA